MTTTILASRLTVATIVKQLLARAGVAASAARLPESRAAQRQQVESLIASGVRVCVVDSAEEIDGALSLPVRPSLAAWLTRDRSANEAVLGIADVPPAEAAKAWLEGLDLDQDRKFALSLDGLALARRLDLSVLAAFSPELRSTLALLDPTWATTQSIARARGRPAGIVLFRGSGYALCLELLHLGDGAMVTPDQLAAAIQLSRTPTVRLVHECVRRGYLRRRAPRGPLMVRNTQRIVDELTADERARRNQTPLRSLGVRTDRAAATLLTRLSTALSQRGSLLAVSGAAAVREFGGDHLAGGPTLAYANLDVVDHLPLGDWYRDERSPLVVLVAPADRGVLHRLRPGTPPLVSPWQAVVDLLTSNSERERETGQLVRQRLLESAR